MESFWARMQVEFLDRRRWLTRIELANATFECLEIFHNRQRRHTTLAMRTPIMPSVSTGGTPRCVIVEWKPRQSQLVFQLTHVSNTHTRAFRHYVTQAGVAKISIVVLHDFEQG